MSRQKKGKYWSASDLRRRGWTRALMKDFLPPPFCRLSPSGQNVRLWSRADVEQAEENPVVRANLAPPDPAEGSAQPRRKPLPGAKHAIRLLEESWAASEDDGSALRRLAGYYHQGLLDRIPAAAKGRNLLASQAMAWLQEFLALENAAAGAQTAGAQTAGAQTAGAQTAGAQVSGVLANFLRAAGWFGQREQAPLTRQVLARYPAVLQAVAARAVEDFTAAQPEARWEDMLALESFPVSMLLQSGLGHVWSVWYVPQAIRTSLSLLVALNPMYEYPEARAMHRRFVLHLGGTNTGKTYAGFQRLKQVRTGVYLAPLRLLALEAQETLLDAGVACSLSTGEEEDSQEDDTHLAATAEKLDLKRHFDVAVIDECQMIADARRGYAWTRAILGVLAPEVHLCAAPEAEPLLIRLIESCGDSYEREFHQRNTPLICMTRTVDYDRIQPGDALITFSKVGVLSVAEDLRQNGKKPAIIYGALPYATRRRQMEGFLAGEMEYIVSTDAIGMGLNLPIRRVIFMETEKFDGVQRRELTPSEIRQIAGRAGRYGMYSRGYVGATQNLGVIRAGLEAVVPPLEYAVVGFSDMVLQADFDLLEVLTQWNQMPVAPPYRKLDISRYITVISKMREMGFCLSKEQELRAANIPFDETEEPLRDLFFHFLRLWQEGQPIEQPGIQDNLPTLPELELYYRKLDLYFSFSKAFGCAIDEDKLYETRQDVAEAINEILLHRLRDNIRFCASCGKALPLHQKGRLCGACFQKERKPAPWRTGRK